MEAPLQGQVSGCGCVAPAMAAHVTLQGYFKQVPTTLFESNCSQNRVTLATARVYKMKEKKVLLLVLQQCTP